MKKLLASLFSISLCAVVFSLPLVGASQTVTSHSSTHQKEHSITVNDDNWQWHHSDNGVNLYVTIRGKAQFADDYSDVTALSPDGGELRIKDERGGVTRKFEATASNGEIKRVYSVNGHAQAMDGDARAWLARVLNETVRLGGYDAPARVARLLQRGGPNAVLAEVSELKGDYVKGLYFHELIKQGSLDAQTTRSVLQRAAREISSDYEKAEILLKVAAMGLNDEQARTVYLEGVNTIHSDYERGRTMSAMFQKNNLSKANALFALKSLATISSSYEKAELLVKASRSFDLDETLQSAYLEAVATIGSDYEKGRAIGALLNKHDASRATLLFMVKSASAISSDYEKAQLLIRVADAGKGDEAVRSAITDTARTIRSDYDRGRVLSAVIK
jgi:hypothetical protein